MSDHLAAECRYCGIKPDQDFPRPSYHDMRVEVARLREALEAARAALVEWGNRPTNSGYERRYVSRAELAAIDAALAEGSDVPTTQGETP